MKYKRRVNSFFIMIIMLLVLLSGCRKSGEQGQAADSESVSSSSGSFDSENEDESLIVEGSSASEYDWEEEFYKGISYWAPTQWDKEEADDGASLKYLDTQSPDYFLLEYDNNTSFTSEEREDPLLYENALINGGYVDPNSSQGVAVMLGDGLAFKVTGSYSIDDISYQGIVYFIPVGDYGTIVASFMHAQDVDDESDHSCLEMVISTLKIDDESIPEDSRNLGITMLGTLPVTLVDDDNFVITATAITNEGISLNIVNNSDEKNSIMLQELSINGYMVDGAINYEYDGFDFSSSSLYLEGGKQQEVVLTAENLEEYNITDIGRVGIKFYCYDSSYNTFYDSDYLIFDTVEDYDKDSYATYEASDDIVYQDENVVITYEGITDSNACFGIRSLKNEIIDVSGKKVSVDGEFVSTSAYATVYPDTFCRMKLEKAEFTSGSEMLISFQITVNSSRYSTDNCSVNL